MQHIFDVEIAAKYGLHEAIIIKHLDYWIAKNEANNKNYYEGSYWTYNSIKAFKELFPYMTERQISYTLKHLEKEGIIKVGNFNKSAYDRTNWYTLCKNVKSILQFCKMEDTNMQNEFDKNDTPIPNINTNIYTNNNNNNIYEFVEQNFGRTLNPIEYEKISSWEDNDLTRYVIKEAILGGKYNIKYIDVVLHSYKMNNITTVQQAQEEKERFKNKSEPKPEWFDKNVEKTAPEDKEREEIEKLIKNYN